MKASLRDRWPLLLAPLLFGALDWGLTCGKQPPPGEPPNELNPAAAAALSAGLWAQPILIVGWTLVVLLPALCLPRLVAIWYSLVWAFGHAAMALHWLMFDYALGYETVYWYCPATAVVFVWVGHRMFTPRSEG